MARNAYQLARHVLRTLRAARHEAVLAGGCVRDLLLGVRPKDYDVATSARPELVARLFRRTRMVGASFGVVIVVEGGHKIEVATFRTEGPYSDGRRPDTVQFATASDDARRRDFTINGMFYDPAAGRVIDYVGGRADLRRRRIRAIGDPERRFSEDYLRMLRAVRFAARLGFRLDPATAAAVRRHAGKIRRIAAERVWEELVGLLACRRRADGVRLAAELGLLEHVLPEAEAGLDEGLAVLAALPSRASAALCMAALLSFGRDAKRSASEYGGDRGRAPLRVAAQSEAEAGPAAAIRRLRAPGEVAARVGWLVSHRMLAHWQSQLDDAALRRAAAHQGWDELCLLTRAAAAAVGEPSMAEYRALRRRVGRWRGEPLLPPPLLDGDALVAMGYAPGPRFGPALRAVYDAQLNGRIHTRAEAVRMARELMGA